MSQITIRQAVSALATFSDNNHQTEQAINLILPLIKKNCHSKREALVSVCGTTDTWSIAMMILGQMYQPGSKDGNSPLISFYKSMVKHDYDEDRCVKTFITQVKRDISQLITQETKHPKSELSKRIGKSLKTLESEGILSSINKGSEWWPTQIEKPPTVPSQKISEITKSLNTIHPKGSSHLADSRLPTDSQLNTFFSELFHQHPSTFKFFDIYTIVTQIFNITILSSLDTPLNTEDKDNHSTLGDTIPAPPDSSTSERPTELTKKIIQSLVDLDKGAPFPTGEKYSHLFIHCTLWNQKVNAYSAQRNIANSTVAERQQKIDSTLKSIASAGFSLDEFKDAIDFLRLRFAHYSPEKTHSSSL